MPRLTPSMALERRLLETMIQRFEKERFPPLPARVWHKWYHRAKALGLPYYVPEKGFRFAFLASAEQSEIRLAGEWGGWHPSAPLKALPGSSLHTCLLPLPADSYVGYKWVVDGAWMMDPAHDRLVGAGPGIHNALLSDPQWPSPLAGLGVLGTAEGLWEDWGAVESRDLKGKRRVQLYQTRAEGAGAQDIPLIICQDGDENIHRGELPQVLDALARARGQNYAMLFIEHPGAERHLDYTPFFEGHRVEAYGDFVVQVLLPRLKMHPGLTQDPARRILLGHSFGATCALSVASRYPQVFGRLALQSGVYRWEGDETLLNWAKEKLGPQHRIYIDSTRFGMEGRQASHLVGVLGREAIPHLYRRRGTGHIYEGWRFWLPEILEYLLTAS